jgi:formylglycine-generating enzyme required for sulfatase activity
MVGIEGGTFTMGFADEDAYNAAGMNVLFDPWNTVMAGSYTFGDYFGGHSVNVSSFSIGETEVTQALWTAVMSSNPSSYTATDQHPVENVSWYDIVGYGESSTGSGITQTGETYTTDNIDTYGYPSVAATTKYTVNGINYYDNGFMYKLSYLVDNGLSKKFRLPTEAEWEYAAHGNEDHLYSGSDDICDVAWYSGNDDNSTG